MEYQTFRGADVKEALFAVRQALGADAMIESTRHLTNGQSGALGHSVVEIVAAPATAGRPRMGERLGARGVGRVNAARIERELLALRAMVDELSASRPPRDRIRAVLNAAGFEGDLAKSLAAGATRPAKDGRAALVEYLRSRVGERLLCQPRLIERNFRQLIACVGPTGVGKTTTLAKLAARARLELQRSVTVVSLDTFRVGAVEQWQRYAELIGVQFYVAEDAATFSRIVESSPSDIILVDSAGQAAHEDASMLRLGSCLQSVKNIRTEVQLVLPAWIRARDAERIAAAYVRPHLTGLIVTKLDEAEQVGGSIHAALAGQLPVTYLCDGARVPEDIRDAARESVLNALFPEQT